MISVKNTSLWQILKNALSALDKNEVEVGWFSNFKYENGDFVAEVAYKNEKGDPTKRRPPRPFVRPAVEKNAKEWSKIFEHESKQILNGETSSTEAMQRIAEKTRGDIAKEITRLQLPKLAESTIEARLSKRKNGKFLGKLNKPLVDDGIMLNTLSWKVNGKLGEKK